MLVVAKAEHYSRGTMAKTQIRTKRFNDRFRTNHQKTCYFWEPNVSPTGLLSAFWDVGPYCTHQKLLHNRSPTMYCILAHMLRAQRKECSAYKQPTIYREKQTKAKHDSFTTIGAKEVSIRSAFTIDYVQRNAGDAYVLLPLNTNTPPRPPIGTDGKAPQERPHTATLKSRTIDTSLPIQGKAGRALRPCAQDNRSTPNHTQCTIPLSLCEQKICRLCKHYNISIKYHPLLRPPCPKQWGVISVEAATTRAFQSGHNCCCLNILYMCVGE